MDFSDNFYTLRKLTGDYYSSHQDVYIRVNKILQKGIIIPVEYKRQASNKGNHLKNIFQSLFYPKVDVISGISNLNVVGREFEIEWLNEKKESVCKTTFKITSSTGTEDKRGIAFRKGHKSYIKVTEKPYTEIDLTKQINVAKQMCYKEIHAFLILVLTHQSMVSDISKICETFNLPNNLLEKIQNKQIENEELFHIIQTNFIIPYNDLSAINYLAYHIGSYGEWFNKRYFPDKKTHDIMKKIVKTGFYFFDREVQKTLNLFLKEQNEFIEELKKYQINS